MTRTIVYCIVQKFFGEDKHPGRNLTIRPVSASNAAGLSLLCSQNISIASAKSHCVSFRNGIMSFSAMELNMSDSIYELEKIIMVLESELQQKTSRLNELELAMQDLLLSKPKGADSPAMKLAFRKAEAIAWK